jgi:nucleoid-associated protein YgaU
LILIIAGVGLMNRNDTEAGAGKTDTVASNSRTDVKKPRAKASRLTSRRSTKVAPPRTTNPRLTKPAPVNGTTSDPIVKKTLSTIPAGVKPLTTKPTPAVRPVATSKIVKPVPVLTIPKTYTVKAGDVLSKIAFRTYGTTRMVSAIAMANPGMNEDQLEVGQELKLPRMDPTITAAGTKPTTAGTSASATVTRPSIRPGFITASYIASNKSGRAAAAKVTPKGSYRVKSGDTISSIAQKQLGSVRHTNRIVAANQTLLKNPNRLQVGWLIKLPAVN